MKSNTRFKKNTKGIECLNCKQPISTSDNFCSNCGQVNDTKPLSLKQYVNQLLGGFFAFDTRTINTLIPLITKPGKVTKEYIEGKRMQYVNPFQLYLHASIIFFLVTSIFMSIDNYKSLAKTNHITNQQKKDSILNEVQKDLKKNGMEFNEGKMNLNYHYKIKKNDTIVNNITEPENENNAVDDFMKGWNSVGSVKNKYKEKISENAKLFVAKKEFLKTVNDSLLNKTKKDSIINKLLNNNISSLYSQMVEDSLFIKQKLFKYKKFKKYYLKNVTKEIKLKKINYKLHKSNQSNIVILGSSTNKYGKFVNSPTKDAAKALDSLGYKKSSKNIFLYYKLQELRNMITNKDKEAAKTFFNKMISKASIIMFFMLPLFTLFLSLLYIRNKNNYTEHLIFVFNIQTVFFILLLIGIVFDRIFNTSFGVGIFIFGFLFYLYKATRKFYQQGRIKTIVKLLMLNFVYYLLSLIGLLAVAFLAFIM